MVKRTTLQMDADEWAVKRISELRAQGEVAQLRVVLKDDRIVTVYILRANGSTESQPGFEGVTEKDRPGLCDSLVSTLRGEPENETILRTVIRDENRCPKCHDEAMKLGLEFLSDSTECWLYTCERCTPHPVSGRFIEDGCVKCFGPTKIDFCPFCGFRLPLPLRTAPPSAP